jgi:hypothetical protein
VGLEESEAYRQLQARTEAARQEQIRKDRASVAIGLPKIFEHAGSFYSLSPTFAAKDLFWSVHRDTWRRDGLIATIWHARKTHIIAMGKTPDRVLGEWAICKNPDCGRRHRLVDRSQTDPTGRHHIRGCPHCGHGVWLSVPREYKTTETFSPASGGRRLTKAFLYKRFRITPQKLRSILRKHPL